MIRYLLFDMDMTLLDFARSEAWALSHAMEELGVTPSQELLSAYSRINLSQWKLLEKGLITRERLKIRRFELLFEQFSIELPAQEAARHYEALLAQGYYYLDGARELLESLQGKNYQIYILSNGSSTIQHSRIAGAQLAQYVDGIYISEDVGFNKPDKRFFDACFADISARTGRPFAAAEAVMIGDSLTSDIQGGNRAGVTTIWYHGDGAKPSPDFAPQGTFEEGMQPTYEIHSLEQLPELLALLS